MLRILLLLIALIILIVIGLVALNIVNISGSSEGVTIETRDVDVGTTASNVQLPVVRLENRTIERPSVSVENDAQAANAQ